MLGLFDGAMLGLFEGAILGLSGAYMSSNRVLPLRLIKTDVIKLAIKSTLHSWMSVFVHICIVSS